MSSAIARTRLPTLYRLRLKITDFWATYDQTNMDKAETVKAKEAERHRRLRLKRKNEVAKLRCLRQFLCDKYKSILDEFEIGYDEGKNECVAPQTRTRSSSQTDPWNILDEIADDQTWLPEDVDHLLMWLEGDLD